MLKNNSQTRTRPSTQPKLFGAIALQEAIEMAIPAKTPPKRSVKVVVGPAFPKSNSPMIGPSPFGVAPQTEFIMGSQRTSYMKFMPARSEEKSRGSSQRSKAKQEEPYV